MGLSCSSLCLEGGFCPISNSSTVITTCDCPPDWTSDNIFFHFSNCTMPTYYYSIFCAFYLFISLACALLLARRCALLKRGQLSILSAAMALNMTLHCLVSLSLYLQSGAYEAALTLLAVQFPPFWLSTRQAFLVISLPPQAPQHKPFVTRAVNWYTGSSCVFQMFFTLGMLATCRDSSSFYNEWALAFWIMVTLSSLAGYGAVYFASRTLHKSVKKIIGEDSVLVVRLETFQRSIAHNLPFRALPNITVIVALLVLGSVPFFYIFYSVTLVLNAIIFPTFLILKLTAITSPSSPTPQRTLTNLGVPPPRRWRVRPPRFELQLSTIASSNNNNNNSGHPAD